MEKSRKIYILFILFLIQSVNIEIGGMQIALGELNTDLNKTYENTLLTSSTTNNGKILSTEFNAFGNAFQENKNEITCNTEYTEYSSSDNYGLNPVVAEIPESFFEAYFVYILLSATLIGSVAAKIFFHFK